MQLYPIMWPFILSAIVSITLGIAALKYNKAKSARTFSLLSFAVCAWTLCYVLAYSSHDIADKYFWTQLKYIGASVTPALWLMLAFQLTRRDAWFVDAIKWLLIGWVLVSILVVMTNNQHQLFWYELALVPGVVEAQANHGPYFMFYVSCVYLLVFLSSLLYIDFYRRTKFKARAMVLVLAGVFPIFIHVITRIFSIDLLPGADPVQLALLLSSIFFAYAIFKYDALEFLPIARDKIIEHIEAAIVVVDRKLRIIEMNPFALALTSNTSPIGEALESVYPSLESFDLGVHDEQEMLYEDAETSKHIMFKISQLKEDKVIGYVLFGLDISDRKRVEQALAKQATTDSLTGVSNRRAFFTMANLEMVRSRRQGLPLGLMMLDIDHFKLVNDRYGHQIGDQVLLEMTNRCIACLREIDIFARYGGEEFVCLLMGEREGILQTAERLRVAIGETDFIVDAVAINVTVSIGLSMLDANDENIDQLIDRADKALYQSKQTGRNKIIDESEMIATDV